MNSKQSFKTFLAHLQNLSVLLLFLFTFLAGASSALALCEETIGTPNTSTINQWRPWQWPLTSNNDYASSNGNPYRTVVLRVTYTDCSTGVQIKSYGFWDQLKSYYLRGTFPAGTWQWVTSCSGNTSSVAQDCSADSGLIKSGRVTVNNTTAADTNPLYKNGALRLHSSKTYFTFFNPNRKFFWLGDTAWTASMRASSGPGSDWQNYVTDRSSVVGNRPPFTVIQMATAPMYAGKLNAQGQLDLLNGIPADLSGRRPFEKLSNCTDSTPPPNTCSRWLSPFWTEFEKKVNAANQAGLAVYIAGVMNPLAENGGSPVVPVTAEATIFARNFVARMAGYHVVYSPGFDARPNSTFLPKIKAVGCAIQEASCVAAATPQGGTCNHACSSSWQLITDHPGGGSTLAELQTLPPEIWLDFMTIQSGRCGNECSDDVCQLQCVMRRARTLPFDLASGKPEINGESIYEGSNLFSPNPTTTAGPNHTAHRVRQTAYLSNLSGAVGYSFGTCGIFEWGQGQSLGCPPTAPGGTSWTPATAVGRPSSTQMRSLRYNFQTVFWERLRPQPSRVIGQAGDGQQQAKFVVATDDVDAVLAYVPSDQPFISLDFNAVAGGAAIPGLAGASAIPTTWTVRWLSPRTARDYAPSTITFLSAGRFQFTRLACPAGEGSCDARDWVLRLTRNGTTPPAQPPVSLTALQSRDGFGLAGKTPALQAWSGTDPVTSQTRIMIQGLDGSGVPATAEIAVTGSAWTEVSSPRIAQEPKGTALVVWQSEGQDGDEGGIYARLYDSAGNPLGNEFRVNATTQGDQSHPWVTNLEGGEFAVVWTSSAQGQPPAIFIQTYDRFGAALSPESKVNCAYPGDYPRAGADAWGNVLVAWESENRKEIYAQALDLKGNLVGHESKAASTAGSGFLVLESVGTAASGLESAAVWQIHGPEAKGPVAIGESAESAWIPSDALCR